jgi:hypothetical protein
MNAEGHQDGDVEYQPLGDFIEDDLGGQIENEEEEEEEEEDSSDELDIIAEDEVVEQKPKKDRSFLSDHPTVFYTSGTYAKAE